jgi:hypothetical protein
LRALARAATLAGMPLTEPAVAVAFVDAIVARDVARAVALLHPEIDFRAMTPNRVWEAGDPSGVETILRAWLADPDEEVHGIEATEPSPIVDRMRVGWLVRISDADGLHVFEQQAYVRERDGRIDWLRVICSGWIPVEAGG